MHLTASRVFWLFVFPWIASGLGVAVVRADVIERVVAVVNDDPIFLSELRRRAVPFLERALDAPTDEERMARITALYEQLLEHLVEEKLIEQAARRMEVRVVTDDVERAIGNVQRQSGLTGSRFWEAVSQQGFTETQYREDVRRQLLRLKVMNQRVRGRVNVTLEDVRAEYDRRTRSVRAEALFHVQDVFVRLPASPTATQVAEARREAAAVREGLTAENFEETMARVGGGDLGTLHQSQLPEALASQLLVMNEGDISPPILAGAGLHILLLVERSSEAANVPPFEEARDAIYHELLEAQMGRQERVFLEELKRDGIIVNRLHDEERPARAAATERPAE